MQRRLREARARNVLVSASLLSILGGTATIYAANADSATQSAPIATPNTTNEPVVPTALPETTKPPSVGREDEDDDIESDDDELETQTLPRSTVRNVTVPPTSTPADGSTVPAPAVTSTPTPEIVVDQPSSHSRSHSTPG